MAMSLTAESPANTVRGGDEFEAYRSMSATAVVSAILGMVSIVALLGFTALLAIPALGLLAGLVAWKQITSRPDELSGLQAAKVGVMASAFFLVAGVAQPYVVRYVETPNGYQPISYEQELVNEASPDAPTSAAVNLDGERVFLKGYMFPTSHQNGITRFLLCRDSGDCCFGTTPKKTHMVYVELVDPKQTAYSTQIRHVGGTFHVAKTRSIDVNSDVLYRLDADYIN
jgi:hypothetical protein